MEFNIKNYKGKYVMHCKTEEEAKDFCKVLHDASRVWCSGVSYLISNYWEVYQEDTCYYFNEGAFADKDFVLSETGYRILEWSDFMKKKEIEHTAVGNYQKFNKTDLKSGDIVTYRNGVKGIVFLELDAIVNDDLDGYTKLSNKTSELTSVWESEWDIVKVQRAENIHQFLKPSWDNTPIIWEREETVEMTLAEVCKALGKNVKIVKE